MSATKFTFTNADLFQLAQEVNACLGERISLLLKYRLTELHEKLTKLLKPYMDMRNEQIFKIDKTGNIPAFVENGDGKIPNPKLEKFNKIMKPLDEEEVNFNFRKPALSLLSRIESENNYPFLFKIFENDLEEKDEETATAPVTSKKGRR